MLWNMNHIELWSFTKWYVCFLFLFFYYAKMGNAQTFQRLVSEELYKQYLNPFFKVIPSYFIVIVASIVDFQF